jgi:dTDP-4-amino-4,6-dideoxygalactose transaminase
MTKPRIYLSSPHMGGDELKLVQETFASNWIAPLGPQVDAFEQEFAARVGSAHAAALSSGTAALHLALRWIGVKPGDEVICSSLTFSASANPITYDGGRPVFVDSDDRSWNMDPALLAEALADRAKKGRLPKAVIVVHLYGQSADIDPIERICAEHGVPMIEDAAEALGAVYWGSNAENRKPETGDLKPETGNRKPETGDLRPEVLRAAKPEPSAFSLQSSAFPPGVSPGTRGVAGIFSFNGNKIITTSGGGMLVSNDKALIDKARFWATQARDNAPHYEHSEIGFNYRMSNVLAAIGRGQLHVLEQRVDARRANFEYYRKALGDLPGLAFMPEADYGRCTRWLTCLTIDPAVAGVDRERIRLAMVEENIEARPVWKPLHLQPVFKDCPCYGGAVAERLFDRGLCLPSGSNLTTVDLDRVVEVVRKGFAFRKT